MTKWEPKEKRVNDIISAAMEVFLEKGYEGTSMESIASKAGISKGGLYHHFKSKDEILYYANEKLTEPVYELIDKTLKNTDIISNLREYIKEYLYYWTQHQIELTFFFLTMTKALSCPETWEYYDEYCQGMIDFFEKIFVSGIEAGKFINHNTKAQAVMLMTALDGSLGYLPMCRSLEVDSMIGHFTEVFIKPLLNK